MAIGSFKHPIWRFQKPCDNSLSTRCLFSGWSISFDFVWYWTYVWRQYEVSSWWNCHFCHCQCLTTFEDMHTYLMNCNIHFHLPNYVLSMGSCKKDVTPLLTHWSYVILGLTHRCHLSECEAKWAITFTKKSSVTCKRWRIVNSKYIYQTWLRIMCTGWIIFSGIFSFSVNFSNKRTVGVCKHCCNWLSPSDVIRHGNIIHAIDDDVLTCTHFSHYHSRTSY